EGSRRVREARKLARQPNQAVGGVLGEVDLPVQPGGDRTLPRAVGPFALAAIELPDQRGAGRLQPVALLEGAPHGPGQDLPAELAAPVAAEDLDALLDHDEALVEELGIMRTHVRQHTGTGSPEHPLTVRPWMPGWGGSDA